MNNQDFINKNKFNITLGRMILMVIMLMIVVVGGTFAWFTFSSKESALVLTIGNINNTQITLTPYQVKEEGMTPVNTYTSGVSSDVIIKNNEKNNSVALYYKINQLDANLINNGLKYTIINTKTNETVKTGDFKAFIGKKEALIYENNDVDTNSELTYRVYLWVDSSVGNQNNIAGSKVDIELNGAIGSAEITGENTYGGTLVSNITDFDSHVTTDSGLNNSTVDYEFQWYLSSNSNMSGATTERICNATSRSYIIGSDLGTGTDCIDGSKAIFTGKYIYVLVTARKEAYTKVYKDITDGTDADGDASTGSEKVTAKQIGVTANNGEKTYDGTELKVTACKVTSGSVLSNHSVSCTMTSGSTITDVGTVANVINTVSIKNGTSDVTANYNISKANGTLKVSAKEVAVEWGNTVFVYNGSEQAPTAIITTGVNGETMNVSRTGGIDVGEYTSTASCSGVTGGRTKCTNYTLTNTTKDFEIKTKEVAVEWENKTAFIYNGSEQAPTASVITGVSGETMNVSRTAYTDVGSYTSTASCSSVTGGRAKCTNYTLTNTTKEFSIALKVITVVANSSTKTYDGTVLRDNSCTITDGVSGHAATCSMTAASTITNAGTQKNVINTVVIKEGTTDVTKNYTINKVDGTLTVNKRSVSVTWQNKNEFTYSGSAQAPTASVTTGVSGETMNVVRTTYTDASDTSYTSTASCSSVTGGQALCENYTLTSETKTFKINKKELTIDVTTADKVYDSTTTATCNATITGAVSNEKPTATVSCTFDNADVGTNKNVTEVITLDNGWTKNYYFDEEKEYSLTADITAKNITVTWGSTTSWIYDGNSHVPTVTTPVNGAGSEKINLTVDGAETNAGSYTATASCSSVTGGREKCTNYTFSDTAKAFTIEKATCTCTISSSPTFYYPETLTGDLVYSCTGDGTLSVTSSDTNKITVGEITTTKAPLTAKAIGESVLTVKREIGNNYETCNASETIGVNPVVYTIEYYTYNGGTKLGTSTHTYDTAKNLTTMSALKGSAPSSNVTFYGWATSANSTTSAYTDGQSVKNLTTTNGGVIKLYAIWRSSSVKITYYYGVNKANSGNSGDLYFYNGATSVSYKVPALSNITNWTVLGWRDDTTAGDKEYTGNTSYNFSVSTTLYAVYSRSHSATFYSGINKASSKEITGTAYYNTNTSYLPASVNITTKSASDCTDIPGWTALGYRNDGAAGDKKYDFGEVLQLLFGVTYNYYAVYSRSHKATFYSGINKASSKEITGTAYYNTNTSGLPTSVDITAAGFVSTYGTDLENWDMVGWRDDTTDGNKEYNFGATLTLIFGTTYNYYAVYRRVQGAAFYSGINMAYCKEIIGTAWYNTNTSSVPTTVTITAPTNLKFATSTFDDTDIPGWTVLGYRDDVDTGDKEYDFGEALTVTFGPTHFYYAVYSRSHKATFYSGVNKVTVKEFSNTAYYNTFASSLPTSTTVSTSSGDCTDIENWTELGWRDDTTAGDKEYSFGATISLSFGTTYNFYAVYSRSYKATFYSGVNKITVKEFSGTAYYNTNTSSVPTSVDITTKSASDCTDLQNWTERGWRDDTDDDDKEYDFGATITLTFGETYNFYAVYSRDQIARFYSGKNTEIDSNTFGTTVRYNTNTSSVPTSVTITALSASRCKDIANWTELGWRDDTVNGNKEYDFGATITLTLGNSYTFWAVYSKGSRVVFFSGFNKVKKEEVIAYAYYNTNTSSLPTTVSTTAAPASDCQDITGWTALGWRDDTDDATKEFSFEGTVILALGATHNFYAVYSRSQSATFYSGVNKASSKEITAIAYYNTNNSLLQEAVSITLSAAGDCQDITDWTEKGWRDDTTDGNKEYNFGATITLIFGETYNYYAVYSRSQSVIFYSGVNKASSKGIIHTAYYNTNTSLLPTTVLITTKSASDCQDITDWTEKGWRDDTYIGDKEYDFGATITLTFGETYNYYAVYSRSHKATFYSGVNKATVKEFSGTAYYNSHLSSMPTTVSILAPTANDCTDISGWGELGWRNDTDDGTSEITFGATIELTVGETYNYYAVYSRRHSADFHSGEAGLKVLSLPSAIAYYNTNTELLPTGVTITAPNAISCQDITNWTEKGWRDDTVATASKYNFGATITLKFGKTYNFYAIYQRNQIATFYSGVDKETVQKTAIKYYNSYEAEVPTSVTTTAPSASSCKDIANWTELGYRDDIGSGVNEIDFEESLSLTFGATYNYYAVYTRPLTISYDGNGADSGSTAATTKAVYYNSYSESMSTQEVTLASNGFEKRGYSFVYWAAGSSSGTNYNAGAKYNPSFSYNANPFEVTMYASWFPHVYTIIYNCGENKTEQYAVYDQNVTIEGNKCSSTDIPKGKYFGGWTTKSDGTDDGYGWSGWSGKWVYINGQYGIADYQLKLYPMLLNKTYEVEYSCGVGSGTAPATQTVSYGNNITISTGFGSCSKTGYTPTKWSDPTGDLTWTNWSGKWSYDNGQYGIEQTSDPSKSKLVLTAQYTANTYTVTLNQNGGSGGTTSVTATYDSPMPSITIPTKSGSVFTGYFSTEDAYDLTYTLNGTTYRRVELNHNVNGWGMTTTTDSGKHIHGKITVTDSALTTAPALQFNDLSLTKNTHYTVDTSVSGIYVYYLDFDLTDDMVKKRGNYDYGTAYRFIDIEGGGISASTSVTVNFLSILGKKYYTSSGTSNWIYDIASGTTLYADFDNTFSATFNYYNDKSTVVSCRVPSMANSCSITAPGALIDTSWSNANSLTFDSWSTSTGAAAGSYQASQSITLTSDISLYSVYSRNVTFRSGTKLNLATTAVASDYVEDCNRKQYISYTGLGSEIKSCSPTSISGWTSAGYGVRGGTTVLVKAGESNSLTPLLYDQTILYAIYTRTLTFYSGGGDTFYITKNDKTQYFYSSRGKLSTITDVVPSYRHEVSMEDYDDTILTDLDISGWVYKGWTTSSDSFDAEFEVNSVTPGLTSSNILNAVYERKIYFYSGGNGAPVLDGEATQYYNINYGGTSKLSSVTAPVPRNEVYTGEVSGVAMYDDMANYGWSAICYSQVTGDVASSYCDEEYSFEFSSKSVNNSIKPILEYKNQLYVVYNRDIKFYSGKSENKALDAKLIQKYNASTTPTYVTVPSVKTSLTGWTKLGYTDNTTAIVVTVSNGELSASGQPVAENSFISPNVTYKNTYYAFYEKEWTFRSWHLGLSLDIVQTDIDGKYKQYYNSYGLKSKVKSPTPATINSTWTKVGYALSGAKYSAEIGVNDFVDIEYNSSNVLYALYSRDIKFYSGIGGTNPDKEETQYYNCSGHIKGITSPTADKVVDIGYDFTKSGYVTATVPSVVNGVFNPIFGFGADTNIFALDASTSYYALYKRTIKYHSGNNKATTNSDNVQFYISSGDSGNSVTPNPSWVFYSNIADLSSYGWSPLGYACSTEATTYAYKNQNGVIGATVTPSINCGGNLYAVYQRTVTFYSGINTGPTTEAKTQKYNSGNSTTYSIDLPTAAKTNYESVGWGDAVAWTYMSNTITLNVSDLTKPISPGVTSTNNIYAVYQRTLIFYSGINKATNTVKYQYFSTNGALTKVTLTAASISTNGWGNSVGWTTSTTAVTSTTHGTGEISPYFSGSNTLYAVYKRDVEFQSGYMSGINVLSVDQWYTSNGRLSLVEVPSLSNLTFEGKTWTGKGYRADNTSAAAQYTSGSTVTPAVDATIRYYAVYSIFANFLRLNNSPASAEVYLNSASGCGVTAPANPGNAGAWTFDGWSSLTYASKSTIAAGGVVGSCYTTYYGIYRRSVTLNYDKNATTGTVSGMPSSTSSSVIYVNANSKSTLSATSRSINISSNIPTRSGNYVFVNWHFPSTGAYYDRGSMFTVNNLAYDSGSWSNTLYAQWANKATPT